MASVFDLEFRRHAKEGVWSAVAEVGWDDTGGDMDMNDLIVEVAVVRRRRYFNDFAIAEIDEVALAKFTDEIMPSRQADHRHDEPSRNDGP